MIDHMLLGRVPVRARPPATNSVRAATPLEPEDLMALMAEHLMKHPAPPFYEPGRVLRYEPYPPEPPSPGVTIYWTDAQGRCRRGLEIC